MHMVVWTIGAAVVAIYVAGVIFCARRLVMQRDGQMQEAVARHDRQLQKKKKYAEELIADKKKLEDEALETFTLYEIAKDITQTVSPEDAFAIFKRKLSEHISFKECCFFDPISSDVKKLQEQDGWFVFVLQGKRRRIGYIAVQGIAQGDTEKVMIMGHQFALVLRRISLYQEIERTAITDSLTMVHTRRYALERFEEEMKRSRTRKMALSLLMIDVDFFKQYNDAYGHLAGDQILREVAHIIQANVREIDVAGRYGGEEFCVILPDTDRAGAGYVAERIRQATSDATIKAYDTLVKATVSIGVSTFPEDGKSSVELFDKADWALYRAKKLGRNRVCTFGVYED